VPAVEANRENGDEHQVTPLELFFDLAMVFAFTQVTRLLVQDPTWSGALRGGLILAALWWAWTVYAWLTSALDVDEGGVRLAMLTATGAMLFVALAVPDAFGEDGLLFACAYAVVRLLHITLSTVISGDDPDGRSAIRRFAPPTVVGASLLVGGSFVEGDARLGIWTIAVVIDYLGPVVFGMGGGWHVAAEHFAERHGLIILIALGESIIAIGLGAGSDLAAPILVGAALGVVLISSLWWLYFDVAAIFLRRRLMDATGIGRARLARDAYSYLHLPLVAGIVLLAFGVETALHHTDLQLGVVPAVALFGGTAVYLLGQIAFLYRSTRYLFRWRTACAAGLLILIPAALAATALIALALVTSVCVLLVAYEAIGHGADRQRVRHPETPP
jgi:low temperature requirement protein LtrA